MPGFATIGAYLAVALARLIYLFTIERHQLVHQEHWRTLAACQFADPDLFFPISSSGPSLAQVAQSEGD